MHGRQLFSRGCQYSLGQLQGVEEPHFHPEYQQPCIDGTVLKLDHHTVDLGTGKGLPGHLTIPTNLSTSHLRFRHWTPLAFSLQPGGKNQNVLSCTPGRPLTFLSHLENLKNAAIAAWEVLVLAGCRYGSMHAKEGNSYPEVAERLTV